MTRRTTEKIALSMSIELQAALLDALAAGDDDRIFRILSRQADGDAAYQFVCEEAPRLSSHARGKPAFSELMFIPVIERSQGAVIGNHGAWAAAERCFADALDEWLPRGLRKMVFRGIRPYEWVAAWGPSMLRKHLLAAIPGGVADKCSFSVEEVRLPTDAPRLGFIVIAVTSDSGWPPLSIGDPLRNERFRSVVAHAVNGVSAEMPPIVLAPDHMPLAIADGLCLWLSELHKVRPTQAWSLASVGGNSDHAQMSIRHSSEEGEYLHLGVRRYQIGPRGFDRLTGTLWKCGCETERPPVQ